jgi:hypothetical protein
MESYIPVLLVVAGGYGALTGLMYLLQERILFQPTRELTGTPSDVGLAYEDVRLTTSDDESLHAWWVPRDAARGTLLFFHGNAGNMSGRLETLRTFHDLGLNILIFDYRGYGSSTGMPSEDGLYADAETAWRHLIIGRDIAPSDVVLYGRSLGSGPATWLAERVVEGALILESAFTSVPDAGAHHYPFLPVRLLSTVRFDNLSRVGSCRSPVMVIHSPEDEIIPFEHGRRLYEAARDPKTFLELSGPHSEAFHVSLERYEPAVEEFLGRHMGGIGSETPSTGN